MSTQESRREPAWLRALGDDELPVSVDLPDGAYRRVRTFKHDFFAATGLYEGPDGRVIVKMGRVYPLWGIPMEWLGRWLTRRELAMFHALSGVEGIPKCLGPYDATGMVRVYVEGHPLQRDEWVDDTFFERLETLLDALHRRGIAYVDLEKRENILVGEDGRPWLIDFQISWRWSARWQRRDSLERWLPDWLGRSILTRLQSADRYHLLKHRRRHRPDQLTAAQMAASRRRGFFVNVHRVLFRPFTLCRRGVLKWLTGRSRSPKQDGPEFLSPSGG